MATFKVKVRKGTGKDKFVLTRRVSGFDNAAQVRKQFKRSKRKIKGLKGVVVESVSKVGTKARKKTTKRKPTRRRTRKKKRK